MADIHQLTAFAKPYPDLTLDETAAEAYLKVLSDTQDSRMGFKQYRFVFAVFPDKKNIPKEDKTRLTRQFIGTWEEHKQQLLEFNRMGCGIFVTINRTDGYGRKNHNITGINTVFVEDDDGKPRNFPLEPSIIVETSPGKHHYYFLTSTIHKLEARAVQEHMVNEYNSDKNAKDLSRVLRIPGFYHLKNAEYRVKLRSDKGTRYTWKDIKTYFPPAPVANRCTEEERNRGSSEPSPDTINILTALSFIDPACINDRDSWLKIIMALHYAYRGQQEGRDLALEWSKGTYYRDPNGINPYATEPPDTYVDEDDVNYIWNSFSFDTSDKTPVTLGTLFAQAMEKGFIHNFEPPPFAISKIPDNADDTLKKISRRYAIIRTTGGNVKIVYRNTNSGQYTTMNKQDFELFTLNFKLPSLKQTKQGAIVVQKPAAPIWMEDEDTFRYNDMVFEPKKGVYCSDNREEMPAVQPKSKSLNRFTGFYVKPEEGNTELMQDFVLNVICSGDTAQADHLHKWIAHTRQFPAKKTGLMVTLMGDKGTGKTMMTSIILALHAPYTYKTANFKKLTGQFNEHIAFTTMVSLEEATWGGKEQDNSILKDLITQDTLEVDAKYLSVVKDSPSCFDIIGSANPGFSVPEETRDKERRFWTISISNSRRKDKTYFSQFGDPDSAKRNKILRTYADYLDNLDLNGYDPQDIPAHVGEHSRYNQIESGGDALHFLISLCEDEEVMSVDEDDLMSMDLNSISVNKMWNNIDDAISTRLLIPIKQFKERYTKTSRNERTATISAIHIAKEMDAHLPKPHNKQVKASVKELQAFGHLNKTGSYLEIANRKHCIAHLEAKQLWS